jgi:hypothetical protein
MSKASITGSTKEDAELASASANFRRFLEVLGDDDQRIDGARGAWLSVNPERLPDTFSVRDTRELEKCIVAELRSRLAVAERIADEVVDDVVQSHPAAAPHKRKAWADAPVVYAAPDAETLPPSFVEESPAKPLPSKPARAKPRAPTITMPPPAQMALPVEIHEVNEAPPSTAMMQQEPSSQKQRYVSPFIAQRVASAQMVIPVVAEAERVAPSIWLRSAIFGVIERGTREVVFKKELPTPWAAQLLFSGPELDQSDLDVLLQVVHMASSQGVVDRPLIFTDYAMLTALGRKHSSGNRKWLQDALSRLTSSKVSITLDDEQRGEEVQLLLEQVWGNGRRAVTVTEGCIRMFSDRRYTVFQWKARLSLPTSLAKFLHLYLMSQPTTKWGVGLDTLKQISRTPASRPMRKFKADVLKAIEAIQALDDEHLGLEYAAVEDGLEGPKLVYRRRSNRVAALSVAMGQTPAGKPKPKR